MSSRIDAVLRMGLLPGVAVGLLLAPVPLAVAYAGEASSAIAVSLPPLAPSTSVAVPPVVAEPAEPAPDTVRVGAFNIGWFSGVPGSGFVPRTAQDLARIARVVRSTHAELMCLEEVVDAKAMEVLATELNRIVRDEAAFKWRFVRFPDPHQRQHIGFIYDSRQIQLGRPRLLKELPASKFTRLPVEVEVKVLGTPLAFDMVAVHLKSGVLRDEDVRRRGEEVRLLTEWIFLGRRGKDKDLLLMGDFNAPRDDESMAAIDAVADQGELVAIEDHLQGEARGTHIPFDVALDRGFMTKSLWKKAGIPEAAWIYRFDDFMARAHLVEDFCIFNRSRVWKKELRCDCDERTKPPPDPALASASAPANASASATLATSPASTGGEDEGGPSVAGICDGDTWRWIKSANYLRVSDHRPLLWDLRAVHRAAGAPRASTGEE